MFVILVAVFAGIQFIPVNLNRNSTVSREDLILYLHAPDRVAELLKTSCYDCHSNNTTYPWYNKIQPVGYLLEGHIEKAKKELNLNHFNSYSKRKQKSKLKSMISQIEKDEMPPTTYKLMHPNAVISERDKMILIQWLEKLKDSL